MIGAGETGPERAVRDAAPRYRELFAAAPTALLVTDPYLKIVEANPAAARLLDVDLQYLVGKPLTVFVSSSSRRAFRSWHRVRLGGAAGPAQLRLRRRDDVAVDALVDVTAGSGELYWTLEDRSAEAQSEERVWELNAELEHRVTVQIAERQALVSELPVGVLVLAADGTVSWLNDRAAQILSGWAESLPDLQLSDEHGRTLPESERPWRRALAGETVREARVAVERPDGEPAILSLTAAPITGPNAPGGVVVVVTDVTDRAHAERAEEEFIQNAAHQLRNPIAAITSSVEALEGGAQRDERERARFLRHIARESERMASVVEALLALERLQRRTAGPLLEVVPLRRLLIHVATAAVNGVEIRIDCDERLALVCDRELVRQALENVIENAVRHTGDAPMTIRARRVAKVAQIDVTDGGSGVPDDARERIFDRFYRATPRHRGAGLGLAIAAAATEASRGTLELLPPKEGEGATFRFTLAAADLQ